MFLRNELPKATSSRTPVSKTRVRKNGLRRFKSPLAGPSPRAGACFQLPVSALCRDASLAKYFGVERPSIKKGMLLFAQNNFGGGHIPWPLAILGVLLIVLLLALCLHFACQRSR